MHIQRKENLFQQIHLEEWSKSENSVPLDIPTTGNIKFTLFRLYGVLEHF